MTPPTTNLMRPACAIARQCRTPRLMRRGSAYIVVLMTGILVGVVGVSGVYLSRVERRTQQLTSDAAEARLYAMAGLDLALLIINQSATENDWRNSFGNNGGYPVLDMKIGSGGCSARAVDPLDGDLNNGSHPLVLTGIGEVGDTRYLIEVQLDNQGRPIDGTWRRTID